MLEIFGKQKGKEGDLLLLLRANNEIEIANIAPRPLKLKVEVC